MMPVEALAPNIITVRGMDTVPNPLTPALAMPTISADSMNTAISVCDKSKESKMDRILFNDIRVLLERLPDPYSGSMILRKWRSLSLKRSVSSTI